jgi:hypothetical protein
LWILAALLAVLHAGLTLSMEAPFNLPDEAAYLLNARHLAATVGSPAETADLRGNYFYHPGYSLLISPAFWLTRDPRSLYHAALLVNAVLASLTFVVAARIAQDALGVRDAASIALIAALHPAALLLGCIAVPETALAFFLLLSFWGTVQWLRGRGSGWALLAAAAAGFLYWLHPRGVVVAPAWLLAVALLSVRRRELRPPLLALVAIVFVVLSLGAALNQHLMETSWAGMEAAHAGGQYLTLLTTAHGWKLLLLTTLGQVWYLTAVSFGLAITGALGMVSRAQPVLRRRDPVGQAVLIFAAPLALLTGASALLMAYFIDRGEESGDYLVYGRYNDAYLGLLLLFGLAAWSARDRSQILRSSAIAVVILVAGAAVLRLGWPDSVWAFPVAKLNVFGLGPAITGLRWNATLPVIGIAVSILVALLCWAASASSRAVWAFGILFGVASGFDFRDLAWYQEVGQRMVTVPRALAARPPPEVALLECRDGACLKWFAAAQFLMPETHWILFEEGEPIPEVPVVIAPPRIGVSLHGYRALLREQSIDRTVWERRPGRADVPGPGGG